MVEQGSIPDETPTNLEEELLLEAAKAGDAIEIQGSPLKPPTFSLLAVSPLV